MIPTQCIATVGSSMTSPILCMSYNSYYYFFVIECWRRQASLLLWIRRVIFISREVCDRLFITIQRVVLYIDTILYCDYTEFIYFGILELNNCYLSLCGVLWGDRRPSPVLFVSIVCCHCNIMVRVRGGGGSECESRKVWVFIA